MPHLHVRQTQSSSLSLCRMYPSSRSSVSLPHEQIFIYFLKVSKKYLCDKKNAIPQHTLLFHHFIVASRRTGQLIPIAGAWFHAAPGNLPRVVKEGFLLRCKTGKKEVPSATQGNVQPGSSSRFTRANVSATNFTFQTEQRFLYIIASLFSLGTRLLVLIDGFDPFPPGRCCPFNKCFYFLLPIISFACCRCRANAVCLLRCCRNYVLFVNKTRIS